MPEREKAGRKAIEEVQRLRARVANLERIALRKAGPKDADRELDRAWSEWETTFDAIGDSVILLDSEFNILQANAATSSLLGKPLDEIVGQRCCKLVHGSYEPLENCPLIKTKTTKKRQKAEFYIAEKGIWALVSVDPILDEQGNLTGAVHIIRDITERKRAEEKLRESEAWLMEAQRIAHIGNWEHNLLTNTLTWSDEIFRIFEIDRERFAASCDAFLAVIHPEDRDAVNAACAQSLETRKPCGITHRLLMLDGRIKYVQQQCETYYSPEGKPLRSVGTIQDITERKKAEEVIESLAKFPAENPYPVLRITKDGEVLYSNEAGKLLLMHWNSKVGKAVPEKWRSSITEAFRSKKTKTEEEKVEDRIFSCVIAPVKDAGYVNLYGRDVTERKKAEQQVRQSEQKYKELFESAREAIIIMDLNGKITDANRIVEEYGHTRDYLLGKSIFDFIPVNHRARAARDFDELCHGTPVKGAMEVIGPKGNLMVEYRDNPIVREGQIVAVQAILMDITEQKRAEQALRDYQARLKLLAAELALAEERERHRIAAGIHDGIGQKLALAKMELQLLARSPGKSKIPASLDGVCARIDEAIKDAHSLTFELSNPALYDLSFKAAIDLWLLEKIQKKHGIKCTVIAGEQAVPLDENSKVVLFRALRELAVNVVKHAKATVLTVTVEKLENSVQITCKDDGLGFTPPEEGALPRDVGGFGLFNIKERLEYLGGSMKLQSAPGRGTLVTLSLPAAAAKPLKQQNNADVDEGRQ